MIEWEIYESIDADREEHYHVATASIGPLFLSLAVRREYDGTYRATIESERGSSDAAVGGAVDMAAGQRAAVQLLLDALVETMGALWLPADQPPVSDEHDVLAVQLAPPLRFRSVTHHDARGWGVPSVTHWLPLPAYPASETR